MQVNFEEIVNQPESYLPRQYRECAISSEDYWRVFNNRGESSNFGTSGSGYANWYMYHTMDDRIVCIICSMESWSWQYDGVPPRPRVYLNSNL
jgi:hypothetical protein